MKHYGGKTRKYKYYGGYGMGMDNGMGYNGMGMQKSYGGKSRRYKRYGGKSRRYRYYK